MTETIFGASGAGGEFAPPPSSELFDQWLEAARAELPGVAAQKQFEPPWGFGRHYGPPAHDAVPAAVVALLYPVDGRVVVPLTVRHDRLSAHAGQISLPGGRIDPNESDWNAAVRELHEELGVTEHCVTPIAPLSPLYIFATNYFVRPWLAWSDRRPEFIPNPSEVAEVLEVAVDTLSSPGSRGRHRLRIRGLEPDVPHFAVDGHYIWGATAMILSEIVALGATDAVCSRGER